MFRITEWDNLNMAEKKGGEPDFFWSSFSRFGIFDFFLDHWGCF